jgi:hypothetical protein
LERILIHFNIKTRENEEKEKKIPGDRSVGKDVEKKSSQTQLNPVYELKGKQGNVTECDMREVKSEISIQHEMRCHRYLNKLFFIQLVT